LQEIREAYDLFSRQGDGVMKVALFPQGVPERRRARREDAAAVV
jgi:hypothetical protein